MLRRLAGLTLAIGLASCGDSAEPGTGPVTSVAIVSGDLQKGPGNAELPDPLVVRVLDGDGNPVRGQVVNFRVVAGYGSVFAGSGSSNEDGLVQERWTLGPFSPDTQRVEARAVDPVTGEPIVFAVFRAVATPPDDVPPSGRLSIEPSVEQGVPEVVIGQAPLWGDYVRAHDWFGHPIPGLEVSFAVTGGGTVATTTARTGDNGVASIEGWTVGTTPGLNRLIASAPGFQPDTIEVLAVSRAAFEVTPAAIDVTVDSMVRLAPTLLDAAGNTVLNPRVQYRSLDPAVTTVSADGLVTGVATGQTRIVATSDELADTVAVTVAMGFTTVSAGFGTTCAIRTNGESRCWGSDEFGQLGDGPANSSGTPSVPVAGGLTFRQIGTSRNFSEGFSCGLTAAGTAYCWGSNSVGQLGTGGPSANAPQPVAGGLTFTALEVGGEHACAIAASGKAYCWGGNAYGQVGTGDSTNRAQPTAVAGDLRFAGIATGIAHTCGVTSAGGAYCWGSGDNGRLGQGTTDGSPTPVAVTGGLTFAAVTAGRSHSCGLTTAGAAYCWGDNFMTQIGHGSYLLTDVLTPAAVTGGKTWIALSAGMVTSCGIAADGNAYCWGHSGEHGNLGNGRWDTGNHYAEPQLVVGSHHFSSISIGSRTCAVSTGPGNPVYCWGRTPSLVTGF
jgi:alpha-tubulin suppressor-like RCC1 family protein